MTETQKGNVLLVDDDKFLVDMYSMKFTKAGYAVEACLGANDALQVLKNGFQADAIVLDIIMPEHDGFDFLEALKKDKLGARAALARRRRHRARRSGIPVCTCAQPWPTRRASRAVRPAVRARRLRKKSRGKRSASGYFLLTRPNF